MFFISFSIGKIQAQSTKNFLEINTHFEEHWKEKEPSMLHEEENTEEGGWQQYKRWAHFMKQRTLPSGEIPNPTILWEEWSKFTSENKKYKTSSFSGSWTYLGPDFIPTATADGGTGRINCIVFDPTNSNTIWVGTPAGGLWKSTDAGSTWSCNTDLLSNLGVSDIAIDPTNTQNMYIATGDKFGYDVGGDFWGGTYSAGILKSTDGGLNWNSTSLTYLQTNYTIFQRIIIIPDNPSILIAAASDGIWRSTDSGSNWTKVQSGDFSDMQLNTANSAIAYACTQYYIYKSTDYGQSWSTVYTNTTTADGRTSLAVTAANSSVLYAWFENGNLYKSSDDAATFQKKSNPSNTGTFYGYYDMALAVSPTNENIVFVGGLDIYKSVNGGSAWSQMSYWDDIPTSPTYCHADNHCLAFLPGSGSTIYSGNDGGIFISTSTGSSWTDISQDMGITQLYRLGGSVIDPYLIYMGAQDNGTFQFDNGNSTSVFGADGMECISDYTDKDISYISYQNGVILKSTDGGQNYNDVSPWAYGDWTTPFVMDPVNNKTLYGGYDQVYKTTNGGSTWKTISNVSFNDYINALVVAPSNNQYIYFTNYSNMYVTKNGGTSWTSIKSGLSLNSVSATSIAVSNTDPEKVWVTCSGYLTGKKVYYSSNAGSTWTNVSSNLPNIPVNCIIYQNDSKGLVYIGTDFGVYYKDTLTTDWTFFNTGLPNVIISELEINITNEKLRAATFGRGIWESDLVVDTTTITYPNVAAEFTASSTTIYEGETIQFTDLSSGNPSIWQWTFNGATTTSSTQQNPSATYNTAGVYDVSLYTSNPGNNDTEIKTAYITVLADTSSSIPEPSRITDLIIFPNPTQGIFDINIVLTQAMNVNFIIYNALGDVVYNRSVENTKGDVYPIDLLHCSKGIYYLKVNTDTESQVKKIVLE